MSSCFGWRKSTDDHEPLLPVYNDDTTLQRRLHQKLHTYQMIKALSEGYMPSTEQTIIQLRSLLSADILDPNNHDLSDSGRHLTRYTKKFIQQLIDLLKNKAEKDQVQDFIWYLTQSRIYVDTKSIARQAGKSNIKANATAAYDSLNTVASLLLTNSDFRIFLSDFTATARRVFADTAHSVSQVAEQTAEQLENDEGVANDIVKPSNGEIEAPSGKDLSKQAGDVVEAVADNAVDVAKDAKDSAVTRFKGDEGTQMTNRLKSAISKLRQRPDYNQSVSVLSKLFQRLVITYSRAAEQTVHAIEDNVEENEELDRAIKNFWLLITSFGDPEAWKALEEKFKTLTSHIEKDPEFEKVMTDVGKSVQALLTDPSFLDNAEDRVKEMRDKTKKSKASQNLQADVEDFLHQVDTCIRTTLADEDVAGLIQTSTQVAHVLSPEHAIANKELINDAIHVFVPLAISAVQHIPIPRLEISAPEVDLLLENLIIEPGKTVNHTSFLPYKLRVETYNDLEIRKARFRTVSKTSHLVTIKLDGMSFRAEEIGFWMRAHAGIFRLADQGIASFALDERGMDIHIDVEIGKERMENILTLKDVRVHIHKLNYALRQSKFSWLGWLIKPVLRPILRKVMEKQLSNALADFFHAANRELLFARERLRATRIADPQDLLTFFRAVAARLTPEDDPDLYTRVGLDEPGKGVFKGVYAPGSIAKIWHEEALEAEERIEDGSQIRGWRNEIFDLHVTNMT